MPDLTGGGGPVLVGDGVTPDSGGASGDAGSRRMVNGHIIGTVTAGEDVPTGDPIGSFPVGRRKALTIDLSSTSNGGSVAGPVLVPEWAASFSVYGRSSKWGATTVVQITEGPPASGIRTAFATDVTLTVPGSGENPATRFKACMPGTELWAQTTATTSGADGSAELVFFFSANPPA